MSHAVTLPALDGRDPLGFLAALGLMRLLTEETSNDVALSFSPTTAHAIVHSAHVNTVAIADTLTGIVTAMPPDALIPGVPASYPLSKTGTKGSDPMRCPRDHHRDTLHSVHTAAGDAALRWHTSLVTDLAHDAKQQVALTQFTAPAGQQTVKSFFDKTVSLIRANPEHLHQALTQWQRVPGYTGEYLDHRVLRSAADHPDGESSEIGVPGATWLATMALPMLRLTGDGATLTTTLWRRAAGQRPTMLWPLWHPPLNLAATVTLIEHPGIDLYRNNGNHHNRDGRLHVSTAGWHALGVFAVAAARRQPIQGRKSAGVLVPVPIATTT